MKPKLHVILEKAIEEGVLSVVGIRAHKHNRTS
jgi:hypothetical protein